MVAMAISNQVGLRETVERKTWTSADWREIGLFLAQSLGLVGSAVLLYFLGPALGMALIVGGVAVWLLLMNQSASATDEGGPAETSGQAATVNAPSHCSDPAWSRGGRLAMCIESAAHAVQRQGA